MSTLEIIAILAAGVIIAGLGVYAGRLLFLLKAQNKRHQDARHKRLESMQVSIHTIAFAMQQQQCDLSEGVIRICRLLESLPLDPLPDYRSEFPHVHALFDKVKDYPTHEERNNLSKNVRKAQDREREGFESELESSILKETEALRKFNPLI